MSTPLSHAFWKGNEVCWQWKDEGFSFSQQQLIEPLHSSACQSLFNHISSCLFKNCVQALGEMESREFWQNHLISTEGAAGSWKLGSGVMVLQQCLPGKVVPHHRQFLSDKERGDGGCGPYLLIKQLKTLALRVTQRNSYLWVLNCLSCILSAKGLKVFKGFHTTVHDKIVRYRISFDVQRDWELLHEHWSTQGLNNLTLQGSFYSIHSLSHRPQWQAFSVFFFLPLCFYHHLHKLRLEESAGVRNGAVTLWKPEAASEQN